MGDIPGRLYRGDVSINFVGRQRMWYAISGVILLVSVLALLFRGLHYSVDFKGGAVFSFHDPAVTSSGSISRVVNSAGGGDATVQNVGIGSHQSWQIQTKQLTTPQIEHVQNALSRTFGIPVNNINTTFVGPTWGSEITHKAAEALIVFLIVIVLYLSIAFEWKMAIAAFVALAHDIVITVGVYALTGFQVSPTSVIGLLTILGYSLYDTVVVFDKVRENTAGLLSSGRSTYSQAANLALNQTLVRSINTSLIALLPVASILFVGAGLLGAGTLKDLALVLFVGMLSGTYSSICIATPVLADLKEREPQYRALAKRVLARQAGSRAAKRAAARAQAPGRRDGGLAGDDTPGAAADTAAVEEQDAVLDTVDDRDDVARPDESELTVSASQARTPRPAGGARPSGPRQQPRRTSAAQRRPGARKKRR
ncbi:MAG: protein translocase subunit SecF [Streptosporangiaceae bacterium]|nr:protein translocase subunit SecF [Streptosporangiaceae bacterium]MBV9856256.1 protein translocase subunit SecF [Streptosporangiaceae bacterium]